MPNMEKQCNQIILLGQMKTDDITYLWFLIAIWGKYLGLSSTKRIQSVQVFFEITVVW